MAYVLLLQTGCTSFSPAASKTALQLDVPFVLQKEGHCGNSALAMVLMYHGHSPDLVTLEEKIHIPALNGTIPALIVEAANDAGFAAEVHSNTTLSQIEAHLAKGVPVITYFGATTKNGIGHFLVVTGLDTAKKKIRIHSGQSQNKWVSLQKFDTKWERGHHTCIAIYPCAN
jgi:ABC-type bacteriocin/lantibiotic exporter with double-glycine peptidase domain